MVKEESQSKEVKEDMFYGSLIIIAMLSVFYIKKHTGNL